MSRPTPHADREFLKAYDPEAFDRPSVTVDVVLVTVQNHALQVLLTRRSQQPFSGHLALPGGFVRADEDLESAAKRVLDHKAGLQGVWLEQLYTFGDPHRDPRTRVITVAYYALVDATRFEAARDAAEDTVLCSLHLPPEAPNGTLPTVLLDDVAHPLAFDHERILALVVQRLRGKIDWSPVGFQLLPELFALRDLQDVHETITGSPVNKDSFRRRMLASGQLEDTGQREKNVSYRPAALYRFRQPSAI